MNRSRLEGLVAEWSKQSSEMVEIANRIGEEHPAYGEFMRDARQCELFVGQLESILAEADGEQAWFPLLGTPFAIRRSMLNEQQAMRNHSQTLGRLAQRGGLCPEEAYTNVLGSELRSLQVREHEAFSALIEASKPAPQARAEVTDELKQLQGVAAELEYADGTQAYRHLQWCKRIRDAVAALAAKAGGGE